MNHPKTIEEYNKLLDTEGAVAVKFSAEWCGPCKTIAPYMEELADENPNIVFVNVDVDTLDGLAHDIRGVPTFKFYQNRNLTTSFSGANKDKLKSAIATLSD